MSNLCDYIHLTPSPCYVLEEELLEKNLKILDRVQKTSGAKILLALKGFAMHSTFGLIGQYLHGTAASGLHEAKLGREFMNKEVHTYSPGFKEEEFEEIIAVSDHIVFNSCAQWERFRPFIKRSAKKVECGIRVNPEYSEIATELYNPCAPFSRLGTPLAQFRPEALEGIDGLHFHTHCEQNSDALERGLVVFEKKFGSYIKNLKWVNFGGGHHITRSDYDVDRLIHIVSSFKERYGVQVYLEPGEAIGWQTGVLIATVLDIVNNGMQLAILDTSAEAHMPDTLAMPYRAEIMGAGEPNEKPHTYRLGGNTCLAGDIIGDYSFDEPLKIGDKLIFEDQCHYTMVKNTTFNGIKLPSIAIWTKQKELKVVRSFGYEDYKMRLS